MVSYIFVKFGFADKYEKEMRTVNGRHFRNIFKETGEFVKLHLFSIEYNILRTCNGNEF